MVIWQIKTTARTEAITACKNCLTPVHPAYLERYAGYCLDCSNAGVPGKDKEIAELRRVLAYILHYNDATEREKAT